LLTLGWPDNEGFPSQGGQDRYCDQFLLGGHRDGFFVEIGANDGETFSNCLYFEEERGWKGLCLEPNPSAFSKLVSRRPTATNLNLAVGSASAELEFPIVTDPEESLYASRDKPSAEGTATVRQVDLPTLFEEHGVREVDLLSIDVEGGEEEILATLAGTEVRPQVICAEENTVPEEMDRVLEGLGYAIDARVWPDRIYVRVEGG